MRRPLDTDRLRAFMRALGEAVRRPTNVYFTGGATAILLGFRASTVDIDLCMVPEQDEVFRAIPELKEKLELNVELASPRDFIPELPGWRERSLFIATEGKISFYHFDLYSQALSKLQRGHAKDLDDVERMHDRGRIETGRLVELFESIEAELYRFPAIDPGAFRRRVEGFARSHHTD
ncbi:MAG TPA: DUF6036 family nucleotidyltransferase [Vicinamibacteria bacterium]|nr:DUF6036 family nucleotidyltransferase [Vicinamibacteria bacterium]